MDARVIRRWGAGVCMSLLAALGGPSGGLRAEEPPGVSPEAQRRLDEEAARQKKLREEVQAQAQAHLDAGRRLLAVYEYEAARLELARSVSLDSSNQDARRLLIEVNNILNKRKDQVQAAVQSLAAQQRVAVQERLVSLNSHLDWGMRFANQAQTDPELSPSERMRRYQQALDYFERAREIIKWMPPGVNVEEQNNQAVRMIGEVRKSVKAMQVDLAERDRQAAQDAAIARATKEAEYEKRRVAVELDHVKALFEVGEYEKAEALAGKILELDPSNAEAHTIQVTARERKHIKKAAWLKEESAEHFLRQREIADRNVIPHEDYLIYPSNWHEIARRTGETARGRAEEPWKEEVRRRLARKVSFEFVDTPLSEALSFLDQLAKVNLILDQKVGAAGAGQIKITLRVTDMDMETALRWVLKLADLEMDLRNQAVFITNKQNMMSDVELEIYDVRDLTSTITDFPGPRIELSATGTTGGAGAGGGVQFVQPQATPTVSAPDLAQMIKERLLAADFADPKTSIEEQSGKLVVMQRPEVHSKIREILRSFRETQTVQVLTQVRFIDTIDGFLEQIGVHVTGLDSASGDPGLDAPQTVANPTTQPSRFGLYPMGGGPGPTTIPSTVGDQILQNWKYAGTGYYLLHPRLDTDFPNMGTANSPSGGASGIRKQFGASQIFQALTSNPTSVLAGGPLGTSLTGSLNRQGAIFQFRFLNSIQANAILQAVRKDQCNDILIAAKLMQFNNQRAHMMVAQQRSYIADYDISGASWDPIIRALTTGVILEVKPTVSHDRRYITLDLRPGVAEFVRMDRVVITGGTVFLPIHLPVIELRFVNTTVTVPDNGTLLFSGLINDRKWDSKTGVPVFSDLPVIGRIFGQNTKQRERRNLLILVNARVILFDEEEEKL